MRPVALALFAIAAANVAILAVVGTYDVRVGRLHLAATYLFKPILYLDAAFLLTLMLTPHRERQGGVTRLGNGQYWIAAVGIVVAIYSASLAINLGYHDWTHRETTSGVSPLHFFAARQADGYYRPLGFVSLWVDNALFGKAVWAYHIQNIAIHLLNGFLLARLARRIGLEEGIARWAGLLFLAAPVCFEAVIWPGARFDLLAATCVLFALERALAGPLWIATSAYVCGVLCKESAYAYPLLLVALTLLGARAGLRFDRRRAVQALAFALLVSIALIGVRILVYGNLGGYPDVNTGGRVNFELTPHSVASLFTRFPAALFAVNSYAGLSAWLRVDVLAFVATATATLLAGAGLGSRSVLIVLAFVAELPAMNVVGWIQPSVQNGRHLYGAAIWIAMAISVALQSSRRDTILRPILLVCLAGAALWNTLAYVRMLRTADKAVDAAAGICGGAQCCRTIILRDVPGDVDGAGPFDDELTRRLHARVPTAAVKTSGTADQCTVVLRWTNGGLVRAAN